MLEGVSAYKNTSVNWTKSQSEILRLLEKEGTKDIRFTNISWETAERGGLMMEQGSYALMIEFFRLTTLPGGASGKVPVRIIVPNIPDPD